MKYADKLMYICDPEKNTGCKKTMCKANHPNHLCICDRTSNAAFAILDENGEPVKAPPPERKAMLSGTKKRIAALEERIEDLERRNRNLYRRMTELTDRDRIKKIAQDVNNKSYLMDLDDDIPSETINKIYDEFSKRLGRAINPNKGRTL